MSDSNDIGKRTDISVGGGWWKYAKPGDTIVCVKGKTSHGFTVIEGSKYTVYAIEPSAVCSEIIVRVREHDNGVDYFGWNVWRFRPVHPLRKSTEKGVQLLKDIAARKREPEEA